MCLEIVDRELQDHLQLMQLKLTAPEFGGVERGFIVVAQQVFVIRDAA